MIGKLGIDEDSHVVVYDSVGVFSSPRGLYTFKGKFPLPVADLVLQLQYRAVYLGYLVYPDFSEIVVDVDLLLLI